MEDHFRKVPVLGLPVLVGCVNAIVSWIEIFLVAGTMHQIDDAYAVYQITFCAAILQFY